MISQAAALNFVGGLPDWVFAGAAKLLRKRNRQNQKDYIASLAYYERFYGKEPCDGLFEPPHRAPAMNLCAEAEFPGGCHRTFCFASGYKVKNPAVRGAFTAAKRNATAYLHLWQHEGGEKRPLVLCLHGFLLGDWRVAEAMFRVRRLFARGVDVALFVLPHHGERTDFFFNQALLTPHDVPLSLEGCAQTQHDLRAALLALRRDGYERIGLIGASLGGYAGISHVALHGDVAFLFAVVPAVRLQDYLMPEPSLFSFPVTDELRQATARALDLVTPEHWRPRISHDAICAVLHAGDKLNDIASSRAWINAWDLQRVVEVTGGHWLYFDKTARGRAWSDWLREKGFSAT